MTGYRGSKRSEDGSILKVICKFIVSCEKIVVGYF